MKIETKYNISQIVYYLLDKDQNPMLIISVWIKDKDLQYECRDYNGNCKYYYEFELTETENVLTKIK